MGLLQGKASTRLNIWFSGRNYTRRYLVPLKLICCFALGDGHKQTFNIENILLTWKFIVSYLYVSSHQDNAQVNAVLRGRRSVTMNTEDGMRKNFS